MTANARLANILNPLKHGLHAESIILPSEIENDWAAFVDETVDHYAPLTAVEHALALRIAELIWRLRFTNWKPCSSGETAQQPRSPASRFTTTLRNDW